MAVTRVICPDQIICDMNGGSYKWSPAAADAAWRKAYLAVGGALYDHTLSADETRFHILLMSGPSHSGKSTTIKSLMKGEHPSFDPTYKPNVIFDATFTTRISRSHITGLVTGFGGIVDVAFMATPKSRCLFRLFKARDKGREQSQMISREVIERQFRQLSKPSYDEGFHTVFTIR